MEKVDLTSATTDEKIRQFLATKHYTSTTIRSKMEDIRLIARENLTEDDIYEKYINYSHITRSHLRNAIRLLEEFKVWEKE